MFASSGQPDFKRRVDHIVEELSACQKASDGGLICAFPDGPLQLRNSLNGGKVQASSAGNSLSAGFHVNRACNTLHLMV
jgi:hypothetical protein